MTCFWDAILSSLNNEDYNLLGFKKRPNREQFITKLKQKNKPCDSVLWQGKYLKKQEKKEHVEAVKCYNTRGIYNGHLTSVCDSFLLLLTELLSLQINHRYLKTNICYKTKKNVRKVLNFRSNRGHFSR